MARMPRSINARTDASGPPLFALPNALNRNDISPPESLNTLVSRSIVNGTHPPVPGGADIDGKTRSVRIGISDVRGESQPGRFITVVLDPVTRTSIRRGFC